MRYQDISNNLNKIKISTIYNSKNIIDVIEKIRKILFDANVNIIDEIKKLEFLLSLFIEKESDIANILTELPIIKKQLNGDITAFLSSDPAIKEEQEVVLCYPGFLAIWLYRIARVFYNMNYYVVARFITEYAHSKTGIDIHPGASIGDNFFIDHGTGIVIGETTCIGNNVKIYHGVTLGAISLNKDVISKDNKRHPSIEDGVIIYSNATILGGKTIIGKNSVIGCNVLVIESVEKNSKITYSNIIR